jgi:TRAP-type C4-dicarboxylate transport system permease small subunit
MRRVLRFIDDKFEEIIGVVMLATCLTLIFIGVVMRLTFKSGIPWQEELSRILYVMVVYIGASYGMKTKDHIRVTFVREMLPPLGRKIMETLTDVVWAGFNVFVIIVSIQIYPKLQRFIGESAILRIPLHWIFLTVPIGCALITVRLVQDYVQKFSGKPEA